MASEEADLSLDLAAALGQSMTLASVQNVLTLHLIVKCTDNFKYQMSSLIVWKCVSKKYFRLAAIHPPRKISICG